MSAALDADGTSVPHVVERFAKRYEIEHPLKSGNGVETVAATDTFTGMRVALKIIDPAFVHPAARMRFQHETKVLRELSGLGTAGLHDAGAADDRLYLAQPLLPGRSLEVLLRDGPICVTDALRIGIDIASALDIAHGAGICHRDVKPANIIVDRSHPVGTATLVDFGFARSQWLDESIRDELVGTVRYLAPESAGSLATPPDERSDLYAVGVVLFECITGGPPFPGPTVGDLLRQHLSMPVPELRSRGIPVPSSVDDLVQRLLRKDPAERYQSAAALAADLTALLHALEAGDPDPHLVIGRLDQRASLTDPSFVGRYAEVGSLGAFVETVAAGSSGLVLVDADSGGGKSRLLSEVALRAVDAGVTVLHGQGVVQAGQRPFTILLGVVDGLIALLEHDAEAKETLRRDLEDVAPAVVRAIPSLAALLGTTSTGADVGPEQFGELRSLGGLRRLLAAVPTPDRPILLVLDDCQWADTLTVRLLAELFPPDDSPPFLGVIAAFRSEEVPSDHPLRTIPRAQALTLGPLTSDAMAALAESMAGPLPAQVRDIVVRLADGNPFMGAAMLRGMVETGALVSAEGGWEVDEGALVDVQAARRSAAFLVRRLELLDADALALLSVGAVLGKQFDIVMAVAIAGTAEGAAAVIADARRRRLLWVDERTGLCTFFHDKIREALLDRLTPAERRQLHSRAADELIAQGGSVHSESVFDLAYHLGAADRQVDALPYALASAELSRQRHALDAAVSHYRMALPGIADDDVATKVIVAEGIGDVLTLQGVYAEAETNLSAARALVDDRSHAAALDGKLGALAFKQGDIATATRHLEGALIRLGKRIPRATPTLLVALVWELLVQIGHTLLPWFVVGRRRAAGHEDDFLAMRLYSRLTYLYWFSSGKIPCAWSHLRGLNLAERYGPSAELGQAYSEHAPVMTMLPSFRRGLRYGLRSFEIRRSLGDVWGQGQSLAFIAVVRYGASDWSAASDTCHEAIRLLRQTGDQWEVNTAAWHDALSQYRLGNLARAAETGRQVYVAANAIGDRASAGIGLSAWTRSVGGRVDLQLISEALADGADDAHTTAELHLAAALCHRTHGDLHAAWSSLEDADATIRTAGLRHDYVIPSYTWRVTVRRELAESTPTLNPALRRSRLRSCARDARRARRLARWYRNNLPHALRESGLVASLRGKRGRALRLIERSIAVAEQQGARYELAQSLLARAEVLSACGGAMSDVETARAEVATIEAGTPDVRVDQADEPTISLFDRFSALLNVGRAITAAASYDALETAIRDAAMTLLRAERCHLVAVTQLGQERLTTQSGESLYGMSRTLIARAVEEGAPVVALEQAGEANESLLLSGIRSALAAPILVDSKAAS
ncbi:MAG TPA: AAA family ATPase, partial [Jatrophihabitantaceae bacterium]|nr:AAA family ATPase [Jatrophihabitantaceae bacterium]